MTKRREKTYKEREALHHVNSGAMKGKQYHYSPTQERAILKEFIRAKDEGLGIDSVFRWFKKTYPDAEGLGWLGFYQKCYRLMRKSKKKDLTTMEPKKRSRIRVGKTSDFFNLYRKRKLGIEGYRRSSVKTKPPISLYTPPVPKKQGRTSKFVLLADGIEIGTFTSLPKLIVEERTVVFES